VATAVLEVSDELDAVVKLGSGTGRYLFCLYDELGRENGPSVEYHACELTRTGRQLAAFLGDQVPAMRLQVHPFDYYSPNLSFLAGKRVLVFTCHSIEQIPELGREVLEEITRQARSCIGLHFEPVGWQLDEALLAARTSSPTSRRRSTDWVRRMARRVEGMLGVSVPRPARPFPGIVVEAGDVGSADRVSSNAAAWSRRLDYNRNLVPLLHRLSADRLLTLVDVDSNAYGANPFNPTTILRWRST
jgi:hypothetical protein